MAAFMLRLLAAATLLVVPAAAVTPIQKVLQLMEELKAKGVAEKKAEEVRFAAFQQFCADTGRVKQEAIATAAARLEDLDAEIAAAEAKLTELGDRIAELDEDIARWVTDKKAATAVRQKEKADFKATLDEYLAINDAIARAIEVMRELNKKVGKVPPKAMLLSVSSRLQRAADAPLARPSVRRALAAWLQATAGSQSSADPLSYEAPEAWAYETQSGGIMGMLQELKEKFRKETDVLEKEELSATHSFETLMAGLEDQTKMAEQEIAQKTKLKAETAQAKAEAEGERAETQRVKEADEKYLEELKALCDSKASDFESRQKLRAEEVEALSKAIEIISSDRIHKEHLPGAPAAEGTPPALAQLRRIPAPGAAAKGQRLAVLYLRTQASKLGSRVLELAAAKAVADPFEKVKKMIRDLIVRLKEEAASEADHKAWCDAEVATNELTRKNKGEEVDALSAKVEKLEAETAQLAQDVADLAAEMSEIDATLAKAESQRAAEKAENEATIADAKESQTAVAEALAVLRDFYAKAGEATALTQQSPAEDAPGTWDSPYTGMQGSSGGVIGLLEVIESDFARLEAETTSAEEAAQSDYEKFKAGAEQEKAVKATESEHKSAKQVTLAEVKASTQTSLKQTQEELDKAEAYYEKLKPSCVDSGVSYEERVQRRNEEIQSLKEALRILDGEDMPARLGA